MIDNRDEKQCCGCGICVDVCPSNCITMTPKTLGSLVAVAEPKRCIQCGRCERYCPIRQYPGRTKHYEKQAYAGYCKDPELRNMGSSGGIAPLIASSLYDKGYAVYGAAFSENNCLRHICVNKPEDLRKIAKSKYLQSCMEGVYTEIREKLKLDQEVLFIGTPCQNSALRNFIPIQYQEKLVLVDFFCHGVPSQRFFDECLAFEDASAGATTISYQFRAKPKRAASPHYFERTAIYNSIEKKTTKLYFNSLFYAAFQKYITLRESCYNCKFSDSKRASDITVGDFHEIDEYIPGIDRFKGVSRIIVNTEKGKEIFNSICDRLWIYELDMEKLQKNGHGFGQQTARPKARDNFVALYEKEGIRGLSNGPLNRKQYRIKNLYYHLPKCVRKLLMRAVGGNKE